MILYHGYAVRALDRAYWHEAVVVDDDGVLSPLSDHVEKIDIAVPAEGDQLLLMPLPEVSKPPLKVHKRKKRTGHAGIPGEGPAGETCGSCAKYRSVLGGTRRFPKCELSRARWTAGPGSDIRKSDPACGRWEQRKEVQS